MSIPAEMAPQVQTDSGAGEARQRGPLPIRPALWISPLNALLAPTECQSAVGHRASIGGTAPSRRAGSVAVRRAAVGIEAERDSSLLEQGGISEETVDPVDETEVESTVTSSGPSINVPAPRIMSHRYRNRWP